VLGSVPSGFLGVILLKSLGHGDRLQADLKVLLGGALLMAASTIIAKSVVQRRRGTAPTGEMADLVVRPLPTVAIGILGGLVVGMTSVGSGSLMIVLLLMLYPSLSASQLVGTDLVQAVPLVLAAAIGHLLWGEFERGLTTSLLIGSVPGVIIGAQISSRVAGGVAWFVTRRRARAPHAATAGSASPG